MVGLFCWGTDLEWVALRDYPELIGGFDWGDSHTFKLFVPVDWIEWNDLIRLAPCAVYITNSETQHSGFFFESINPLNWNGGIGIVDLVPRLAQNSLMEGATGFRCGTEGEWGGRVHAWGDYTFPPPGA